MPANRTAVADIWFDGTLEEIDKALADAPEGEERRSRLEQLAALLRSRPDGVQEVIRSAVESAVQGGRITQEEASLLSPR